MKNTNNLQYTSFQSLLHNFVLSFSMNKQATYWFGSILSTVEQTNPNIVMDLNIKQQIKYLTIMNYALTSIISFYPQNPPSSVYQLLKINFEIVQDKKCQDFNLTIAKMHYINTLAIFSLQNKQYIIAIDCFKEIVDVGIGGLIDGIQEIFLVSLSNYLTLLIHQQNERQFNDPQFEEYKIQLENLFIKFIRKCQNNQIIINIKSIELILIVYKQFENYLKNYQLDIKKIIEKYYKNQYNKKNIFISINFIFYEKIKNNIFIQIKKKNTEFNFYMDFRRRKKKFKQNIFQKIQTKDQYKQIQLNKLQNMLQQSLQVLNRVQKKEKILQEELISNSQIYKQFNKIHSQQLPKLNKIEIIKQRKYQQYNFKNKNKNQNQQQDYIFKTSNNIIIECNKTGLLFSDYAHENRKFVQWNTFTQILLNLKNREYLTQFLRVEIYTQYDFLLLIMMYLSRSNNGNLIFFEIPIPLMEINPLVKLYKQQYKYLKISLMNQYDLNQIVGNIDCYLQQFQIYFKSVYSNQYIQSLNNKIIKKQINLKKCFYLQFLKKSKNNTKIELQQQFSYQELEIAVKKSGDYICLLILKNKIYLQVDITAYNQEIEINLRSMNDKNHNTSNSIKKFKLPLDKIIRYIPNNMELSSYIARFGRIILDFYSHFQDIAHGALTSDFEIVIYASQTQMIQYGRYRSPISVQLIGSRNRFWGIVLRMYDLAFCNEKLVLLLNPYEQFLIEIIKMDHEQCQSILNNLLIDGSVLKSYKWIQNNNKFGLVISIMSYLIPNNFI